MQTAGFAPHLTGALNNMRPEYRSVVMNALITKPRVQGRWLGACDDDGDCFWVIAGRAVTGIMRDAYKTDPIGVTRRIFRVSEERVTEVYREWDGLTQDQMGRFIAGIRAQVMRDMQQIQTQQPTFAPRITDSRELVHV